MKKILLLPALFGVYITVAQDMSIGDANNLLANGNLIISQPYKRPALAPTTAQTKTMLNAGTVAFAGSDSTGRLFDPGGNGNYAAGQMAVATVPAALQSGYEVTLEDVDLGTGDSLIIKTTDPVNPTATILAIGNGYAVSGLFLFNTTSSAALEITFKSNADAGLGRGFKLLFKRMFQVYSPPLPANIPLTALVYNSGTGAVRSGLFDATTVMGFASSNFGILNSTKGDASHSIGYGNKSDGAYSSTFGYINSTTNRALYAMASGFNNYVDGPGSAAFGHAGWTTGTYSFTSGDDNSSLGTAAFSTGGLSSASGNYASTFGYGTLSSSYVCMSLGSYNYTTPTSGTAWINTDPVLIVGNGTGPDKRSNILEFYKDGDMGIAGNFYHFSDQQLKRDIKPLDSSLLKLGGLHGYHYYWKSERASQDQQTGLIAQEVQTAFPELVAKNLKGDLMVNYTGLIPHLVEAINELRQEVTALKSNQADIAVCLCDNVSMDRLSAYPNPASQHLTVTITTSSEGNGSLILYDNSGKLVRQTAISLKAGPNTIMMDIPGLAAGNYRLVANWGNNNHKQLSISKQ